MHSQDMHTSKKPFDLLLQPDGIASIMPHAQLLIELRRRLAAILPDSLKQACSVANYKQGKVIIFATNGAVAAKLKLMHSSLAKQLSERGVQVTGIEVQVQPPEPEQQLIVKSTKIGGNAMESLAKLQDQLPDSQLKNVVAGFLQRERQNPESK
jgi:hypothetical protein